MRSDRRSDADTYLLNRLIGAPLPIETPLAFVGGFTAEPRNALHGSDDDEQAAFHVHDHPSILEPGRGRRERDQGPPPRSETHPHDPQGDPLPARDIGLRAKLTLVTHQ